MTEPAFNIEEMSARERAARTLIAEPLGKETFAPFGDILEASGPPDKIINRGRCGYYGDLADLRFGESTPALSIFLSEARSLPFQVNMVERTASASQTYIPMTRNPYLVIVSAEENGVPGQPKVFLAKAGQGINYHQGTWRSVLTPIKDPGLFAVLETVDTADDLEEHWFERPYFAVIAGS